MGNLGLAKRKLKLIDNYNKMILMNIKNNQALKI